MSALVLFCVAFFFGTIHAYGFIDPFLPVLGIPFFTIVWGYGIGIVVMHYMPKEFYKKLIVIGIFTLMSRFVDYLVQSRFVDYLASPFQIIKILLLF